MNRRENYLCAARFETPEHIPMAAYINSACWLHYPQEALKEIMAEHKLLFPDYHYSPDPVEPIHFPDSIKDQPYTDPWGCLWEASMDGIIGAVAKHPLSSWDGFDEFIPPSAEKSDGRFPIDWQQKAQEIAQARESGNIAVGGLKHGHTFLQICDLRGYENVIFDMVEEEPCLARLIEMVCEFNLDVLRHYLSMGVDVITLPEDLGMQVGPMVSPEYFKKYIKPCYARYIELVRSYSDDIVIHMHSDGDIRSLVDDITDAGVKIINLQDLVNGVDWIASNLAGKYCIELDVDRQTVTPFAEPDKIDALIKEEVETLGRKEGGLMLKYVVFPGIPLANIKAVFDAMERYADYFNRG